MANRYSRNPQCPIHHRNTKWFKKNKTKQSWKNKNGALRQAHAQFSSWKTACLPPWKEECRSRRRLVCSSDLSIVCDRNQQTRELISAWKTSHINTTTQQLPSLSILHRYLGLCLFQFMTWKNVWMCFDLRWWFFDVLFVVVVVVSVWGNCLQFTECYNLTN